MKFKVGDIVQPRNHSERLKVVKIAEGGETVKGPWSSGWKKIEVWGKSKSYIFEDEEGIWSTYPVEYEDNFEYVDHVDLEDIALEELEQDTKKAKSFNKETENLIQTFFKLLKAL